MEKQTVLEWLNTLDEPARSRAIKNMEYFEEESMKPVAERNRESLTDALTSAFIWTSTPEGQQYWSDIFDQSDCAS